MCGCETCRGGEGAGLAVAACRWSAGWGRRASSLKGVGGWELEGQQGEGWWVGGGQEGGWGWGEGEGAGAGASCGGHLPLPPPVELAWRAGTTAAGTLGKTLAARHAHVRVAHEVTQAPRRAHL